MKNKKPKIQTNNGKTTIHVVVDILRLPTGHKPHRSGSGKHDSSPNRMRTRQNQNSKAIEDSK